MVRGGGGGGAERKKVITVTGRRFFSWNWIPEKGFNKHAKGAQLRGSHLSYVILAKGVTMPV